MADKDVRKDRVAGSVLGGVIGLVTGGPIGMIVGGTLGAVGGHAFGVLTADDEKPPPDKS